MNLASQKILNSGETGQRRVTETNHQVALNVRNLMINDLGHGPERLALESEPIEAIEARRLGKPAPAKRLNKA